MKSFSKKKSRVERCGVFIDLGTTNTRVWLMRGARVVASAQARVGVADSARDGSREKISRELKRLLAEVCRGQTADRPTFCIAAGMITSSLGLAEIPHLLAPAGKMELAATVRRFHFPKITALPFFLIPGVRCGETSSAPMTADFMRGEETLCVGLLRKKILPANSTLLNLGSHWKAIRVDHESRIISSVSSLSGELLHAAQTQTILAHSVPQTWPARLDFNWVEAGMNEQRESGLARALYCVRLLRQNKKTSAQNGFAFLCGAFIGADLERLLARKILLPHSRVVIAGSKALGSAWQNALTRADIPSRLLSEKEREQSLQAGLHFFTTRSAHLNLLQPFSLAPGFNRVWERTMCSEPLQRLGLRNGRERKRLKPFPP